MFTPLEVVRAEAKKGARAGEDVLRRRSRVGCRRSAGREESTSNHNTAANTNRREESTYVQSQHAFVA